MIAVGEGFLGELGAWPREKWEQTWCVRAVYRKNVQKGKEELGFFSKIASRVMSGTYDAEQTLCQAQGL